MDWTMQRQSTRRLWNKVMSRSRWTYRHWLSFTEGKSTASPFHNGVKQANDGPNIPIFHFFSLFTLTKGKSTYINSGHINHSLFWENLAPKSKSGGVPPSGKLAESIDNTWGSYDSFKKAMNSALMGVQGSGWAWLIKDTETGSLGIVTRPVCLFFPLFFPSFRFPHSGGW